MKLLTWALAVSVFKSYAIAQSDGTTVKTQEGPVTGTVSPGVRQFLGIPYAVANRWEAPQSAPPRDTTLQATSFGDSCLQAIGGGSKEFLTLVGLGNENVTESEDCLSVNIWAPSVDRKQDTAVMFWIYGGSFQMGTSNTVYYEGQNIVRDNDDVIVVSFNYRLNIFGQPSAPQLMGTSQSVNYGLLDLRAAVEWVHANIGAFGGNPERIILFGESAGSLSADAYTYAYPDDTIVKGTGKHYYSNNVNADKSLKGVIQESGSLAGNALLAPQGNVSSSASWATVASAVGCGSDPTPQQLSCMKAVPFRKLEDIVISTGVSFAPTPDGITYFFDTTHRSSNGKFLRVPTVIGSNAQEGDIFVVALELMNLGLTIPGLTTLGSDAVTEVIFTCPAGISAGDRTQAGVPTWRYRYEAVFPNLSPRSDLRAYHSSEIPVVFGTFNLSAAPPAPPTRTEISLSRYVQSAWVAFARDPAHGLTNFGWPTYHPWRESLVELGNSANKSGATIGLGGKFDFGCTLGEATITLVEEILGKTGSIL